MAPRRGLIISSDQMRVVDTILQQLREVSGVRFIAVVSTSGQPITSSPTDHHPDMLSLASLAASSFAATQQLAGILSEKEFTLLFHEGRELNLHVAQVSDKVLLVIAFGHDTQVGKVRLYTGRAVAALAPVFAEPNGADTPAVVDAAYTAQASEAIEDLFTGQE